MLIFSILFLAQAEPWQKAPEPIHSLLQKKRPPLAYVGAHKKWVYEYERPNMPTIQDLQAPIERLAGMKIDPNTNGRSRDRYYTGINRLNLKGKDRQELKLEEGFRFTIFSPSPSGKHAYMTSLTESGYNLWLVDLDKFTAKPLSKRKLNGSYGTPCKWQNDDTILCKVIPEDRGAPPTEGVNGPRIEQNLGENKPVRTYTNLLQNDLDKSKFDYYFESEIWSFEITGKEQKIFSKAVYQNFSPSPDSNYLLVSELQKPWSTTVPMRRFARRMYVTDTQGKEVQEIENLPVADSINTAFNSVRTGKRSVGWRTDKDASLYMIEALDGGDARKEAKKRDAISSLDAPFKGTATKLFETEMRYYNIDWGVDGKAIIGSYWYDSRMTREWLIDTQNPNDKAILLSERNYQDAYADPGDILVHRNEDNRFVLRYSSNRKFFYRSGNGASPKGVFPFLDQCPMDGSACKRIWQAKGDNYESFNRMLDDDAKRFVTAYQDKETPRNLHLRRKGKRKSKAITNYTDHMPTMAGMQKERITYKRKDGVQLSATLYLPAGYKRGEDAPLPTLLWAYPSEFKSAAAAGQIRNSTFTFSRPSYSSVLFLLTQGYAIVANPTMPIIGEGETEPNDDYVNQLVMGAEAAVEHVVSMGVSDPKRMAIGGHSYGAFTTANLLAHTDLFKAGIARSGAYNRTLTPFGFQSEQRTFWEKPEIYYTMSPFMQAAKINEPILLLHGADDPNAGTYPMQSKRMFEALKGLGATVRWVELPYEEHGYRSQEGVEHVHWEMVNWMDTYVK